MRKIIFAVIIAAAGMCSAAYADGMNIIGISRHMNEPAAPRLRYPIADSVSLAGKDVLEFRWWPAVLGIRAFEFRLYKGYQTYAANLIQKEKLPASASSLALKAGMFEAGQVYTWVLLQVGDGGQKSEKSWNSFKVTK